MDFHTNVCLCSYSAGSLYFFLHNGRLSCDQSTKRASVCGSWTHGKDRSFEYPHSWSLLGNCKTLPPQLASMGYFNKRVTKFKIHFIYIYSKSVQRETVKQLFQLIVCSEWKRRTTHSVYEHNLLSIQVSIQGWSILVPTDPNSVPLWSGDAWTPQAFHVQNVQLCRKRWNGTYKPTGNEFIHLWEPTRMPYLCIALLILFPSPQVYIHCSTSVCLAIPGQFCIPSCPRMSKRWDFNLLNSETRGILILTFFFYLCLQRERSKMLSMGCQGQRVWHLWDLWSLAKARCRQHCVKLKNLVGKMLGKTIIIKEILKSSAY